MLAQLALFRGGFRREEAVAVTGVNLYILASLIDKSLVARTANGRYELHELVRQYAHAQLVAAGELGSVQQRHATAFLAYAERLKAGLYGAVAYRITRMHALISPRFPRPQQQLATTRGDTKSATGVLQGCATSVRILII